MYQPPEAPRLYSRTLGTTNEIVITGELDLGTCPLLKAQLEQAFNGHPQTLVVDMQRVGFIDSTVIAELLSACSRAEANGMHFRVLVVPGPVQRLFELCGVAAILTAQTGPLAEPVRLRPARPTPVVPDRSIALQSTNEV